MAYFKFNSQKLNTNNTSTKLAVKICLQLFTFGSSKLLLPRAVKCQIVTYYQGVIFTRYLVG